MRSFKKTLSGFLYMSVANVPVAIFLVLIFLILTHSSTSLYYALTGLNLWFTKMIPSLFPFMILSGIMVRLNLTESFSALLYPVLRPVLKVSKNVCYGIIMGFLCGFPMGARVTRDLLDRNMITDEEGDFLLAFCNNIGPVYFCSFVLPLLKRSLVWPYVFGMYGIPFLYGILLRHTLCRNMYSAGSKSSLNRRELTACKKGRFTISLLEQIDSSIISATQSILNLGGYMILFNLLNLIPHVLISYQGMPMVIRNLIAPLLEITGGLSMLGTSLPLFSLLILPFGGLSCIAQTYSMIKHSSLSITRYIGHKLVLTGLTACYYLVWFLVDSGSFLL